MTVKLGDKAKDNISGFQGIVVAITTWLHGCRRITIQPQELKDGLPIENRSFDEPQITVLVATNPIPPATTGGPRDEPSRSSDPSR